ncbi:zinc finger protein 287 [Folsomia candida]|uniref:Zinc finger protein 26 n=1 Tax=Folsomia candida TaxID=158441 RepID=A0A226CYG1_FOLCA|nr:zinc finger protein 287 [Folsomia candida]OXA37568.1 Zinc finger protein 26 [Folsomia candida]
MDNSQNFVNCCICGVSDKPIAPLKLQYSHQICELLRKSDIFLQNSQISSWNNCDHCLKLISELNLLITMQCEIVERIKKKIAKEGKTKTSNLFETPDIKEEEEEEYKSETEFESSEFFCKIEVDPDPDESISHDNDEEEDTFTIQTFDPPTPTGATSSEESGSPDEDSLPFDPLSSRTPAGEATTSSNTSRRPKSPPGPRVCPTCNKLFRGGHAKQRLRLHIEHVHGNVRKFACPYCPNNLAFTTKQLWLRHLLQKHEILTPEKSLSCPTCPKKFAISQLHKRHLENHAKLDMFPFFCPICDTRFKREGQLKRHTMGSCPLLETTSKEQKTFPCSNCDAKFLQPIKLAIHQRSRHPELLTWICATCGSLHLTESHLATHSLLHENSDSYGCLVCKRGIFNTKDHLSLHLSKNHTGEATIPCGVPGCPALFPNVPSKLQHMGSAHNEAVFPCTSCAEKFVTLSARIAHAQSAHKDAGLESFPCEWDACGKVFTTRAALGRHVRKLHMRIGHKMCEICGKELTTPQSYRDHMKIHNGVKDIICEVCGRGFTCRKILECHMVTHTGERPFKCKFCEKAYTQRHVLTSHVRKVHGND